MERNTRTGQKAQENLTSPVDKYEKKGVGHKSKNKLSGRD